MLKALVTDLERIFNGEHPDERQLSNSPAITSWKLSARRATCLEGVLFEHPRLGQIVPNGITSELWLLDLDRNYARTFSRFYRLGQKTSAIEKNAHAAARHQLNSQFEFFCGSIEEHERLPEEIWHENCR